MKNKNLNSKIFGIKNEIPEVIYQDKDREKDKDRDIKQIIPNPKDENEVPSNKASASPTNDKEQEPRELSIITNQTTGPPPLSDNTNMIAMASKTTLTNLTQTTNTSSPTKKQPGNITGVSNPPMTTVTTISNTSDPSYQPNKAEPYWIFKKELIEQNPNLNSFELEKVII